MPYPITFFNWTLIFWVVLRLGVELRMDTKMTCVQKRLNHVLKSVNHCRLNNLYNKGGGTYMFS